MIPIGTKPMTIDQIRDVLKTHWGYDGFLPVSYTHLTLPTSDLV